MPWWTSGIVATSQRSTALMASVAPVTVAAPRKIWDQQNYRERGRGFRGNFRLIMGIFWENHINLFLKMLEGLEVSWSWVPSRCTHQLLDASNFKLTWLWDWSLWCLGDTVSYISFRSTNMAHWTCLKHHKKQVQVANTSMWRQVLDDAKSLPNCHAGHSPQQHATLPTHQTVPRTTQYYKVLIPLCTKRYYSVLLSINPVWLQSFSVLQNTPPALLCTTKCYSSTAPYYNELFQYYFAPQKPLQFYCKVLIQYFSVLQSTTPVFQDPAWLWIVLPSLGQPILHRPGARGCEADRTSTSALTLRYGAPASMEHLEVMVGFFYQWKMFGGWKVGWVWLGLLGRFPFLLWGFWGCPGRNTLKRQSWEVLFKKSEDENGTRQKKAMWSGGKSPFLSDNSQHFITHLRLMKSTTYRSFLHLCVWDNPQACCLVLLEGVWEESFVCSTSWCGDPWVDRTW